MKSAQKRLGDKSRLMIHGGVIFPNTHFNSAGRNIIGLWLPLSPSRTEVWRWLFVRAMRRTRSRRRLREYYLRYAGPAGMVEQDDMENWTAAQYGAERPRLAQLPVQLPASDGVGASLSA